MLYTALQYDDGPIAVRYPRGNGLGVKMDEQLQVLPIGKWETLQDGNELCILTFGTMLPVAEEAMANLSSQGVSVKLVNANSAKPLDEALLHSLAQTNIPVLTLEEAALQGGFGSAVLEFFHDNDYHNMQVSRMGIPDYYIEHGGVGQLLEEIGLTVNRVTEQIQAMLPRQQKKGITDGEKGMGRPFISQSGFMRYERGGKEVDYGWARLLGNGANLARNEN